ncbi:branched-chain amino acid transport system permease protein [Plasticicumulans lactativorans]|uniref:Branched-chain amino acid transport system permease protein n=1 Tax=Plasticicumulans lactativorans TaxID=1133106 RepID=A0A4R2L704_9GAMM|nr:high-affinity branched-chain amino acid ABC transporter permease LivM [Plasticicumulans lactativorans]TCO81067.1 branched-chain amino acid transport system permease protein [Plasticicumulans lactativorans]
MRAKVHEPIDFGHALRDALVTGVLTLLVLGPVTNLVLDGYAITAELLRGPLIVNGIGLALVVALGRFVVAVGVQTPAGRDLLTRFGQKGAHGVTVETAADNDWHRVLRPLVIGGALSLLLLVLSRFGLMDVQRAAALVLIVLFVVLGQGLGSLRRRGQSSPWRILVPLLFVAGLVLPLLFNAWGLFPKTWIGNLILALIYVLLGLGLNIVVGLAGLLDLGFVAFYAVGAYFLALGAQYFGIGFWTALLCAPILAACCGAVLGFPVLRMHGDYLAIVTLGFGEIIRLILNNWLEVTGGPNGAPAPGPSLFGLEFGRVARGEGNTPFHEFFGLEYSADYKFLFIYLVLFVVVAAMIRFITRLRAMPMGRAWEALREDEIACRSLGINHVVVKLTAFMMGAMTGGIAGVFFATYQGFVNPTSFNFFESVLILAIVVLGGMGSTLGVIIAALVLTLLPEVLRDFADYRVLLFGALMVLMMIWRPRGLIRPKRPAFAPKGA